MSGFELSHWERQGYVVEKRYATPYESQARYVSGIVKARCDRGEDVIMLWHEADGYALIMVRGATP